MARRWSVYIAHAEGEEAEAVRLAAPLKKAGYDVQHQGTVLVGDSIVRLAHDFIKNGGPVVLCGTQKASRTGLLGRILDNVAANAEQTHLFPVRMNDQADMSQLIDRDIRFADCATDFDTGIRDLLRALQHRFPLEGAAPEGNGAAEPSGAEIGGPAVSDDQEPENRKKKHGHGKQSNIAEAQKAFVTKLLADPAVVPFYENLLSRINSDHQPDTPVQCAKGVVDWFVTTYSKTDDIRRLFILIQGTLSSSAERAGAGSGNAVLSAIEEAAAALYCLVAIRLFNPKACKPDGYVIQMKNPDDLTCGLAVASIYKTKVILELSSENPALPTIRHAYRLSPDAGSTDPARSIERKLFQRLRRRDGFECDFALDNTYLNGGDQALLEVMLLEIKVDEGVMPVVIIEGTPNSGSFHHFTSSYNVPIVLQDDAATEFFKLDIEKLRQHFRRFWEMRPSSRQKAGTGLMHPLIYTGAKVSENKRQSLIISSKRQISGVSRSSGMVGIRS